MEKQLHTTTEEILKREVVPVKNFHGLGKPEHGTGFWTSTYIEGEGSEWTDFAVGQLGWEHHNRGFILTPKKDARILHITSKKSVDLLYENYLCQDLMHKSLSEMIKPIDFEKLAKDYDGIHIIGRYVADFDPDLDKALSSFRLSLDITFHSWDVESTLWFRWCFEDEVERYVHK